MAVRNSAVIRKAIAILVLVVTTFTVACEAEEDPGTDTDDVGVTTSPAGDNGGY